jgi:cytochrome c oxidase subunit 1
MFSDFNVVSSIGAFAFFVSQFLFIGNMLYCMFAKRDGKVPDRVWEGAKGLEWTVSSPAPYHTFEDPPQVGEDGEPVKIGKTAAAHH